MAINRAVLAERAARNPRIIYRDPRNVGTAATDPAARVDAAPTTHGFVQRKPRVARKRRAPSPYYFTLVTIDRRWDK